MKHPKIHILSLVWYQFLPAKYGGQKVIHQLHEAIGKHYSLSCYCSKNNVLDKTLSYQIHNILPSSFFQIISPFVWLKIIRFSKQKKITHLWLEHPYHFPIAWILKYVYDIKIIYRSHNIEYIRFKFLGNPFWRLLKWVEQRLIKLSTANIFISLQDQELMNHQFPKTKSKNFYIPYCPSFSKQLASPKNNIVLLFSGTLDYAPNAKAVEWIAKFIQPHFQKFTSIEFWISGRLKHPNFYYLSSFQNKQIKLLGEVDNWDYILNSCSLFIAPVITPTGIQTKILDALAYNKPVIAFKSGLNGLENYFPTTLLKPIDDFQVQQFVDAIQASINSIEKKSAQKFPQQFQLHYYLPTIHTILQMK